MVLEPPERGSNKFAIATAEQSVSDFASHVYPSLAQLCSAVCSFAEGRAQTATILLGAAEYDVCFEPQSDPSLSVVRVVLYRNSQRGRGVTGETVLEHADAVAEIVLPFWRALRSLETSLPADSFRSRWGSEFPHLEMAALGERVDALKVKGDA